MGGVVDWQQHLSEKEKIEENLLKTLDQIVGIR